MLNFLTTIDFLEPNCDNFNLLIFILIYPIWVGDLGTRKNSLFWRLRLIFAFLYFCACWACTNNILNVSQHKYTPFRTTKNLTYAECAENILSMLGMRKIFFLYAQYAMKGLSCFYVPERPFMHLTVCCGFLISSGWGWWVDGGEARGLSWRGRIL